MPTPRVQAAAEGMPSLTNPTVHDGPMNRRDALCAIGTGSALGSVALLGVGLAACTPTEAPAADIVSAELALAIETHRKTLAALYASGEAQELAEKALKADQGNAALRAEFDACEEAFNAACERDSDAHHALLAVPILTLADMRAKAAYLASVSRDIIHDASTMTLLLASMGGQIAVSAPTRDPMLEAVDEYEAAYALQGKMAEAEDWKGCEAIYNARIGPAEDIIHSGPTVTTLAGVAAVVRYVANDKDWVEENHVPALRSALAFLEGRAA